MKDNTRLRVDCFRHGAYGVDALKCAQESLVLTSAAHEIDLSEPTTPVTEETEKPKMTKETGDNDGH
jgi:hypothetical protein